MMNEDTITDYLSGIKEFALTDRDNNMCHRRYRVHWLISEVERLRRRVEKFEVRTCAICNDTGKLDDAQAWDCGEESSECPYCPQKMDGILKWLDNNFTFCDPGEFPILGEVLRRIWYHATDDTESFTFSEIMGKALEKE